MNEPIARQWIAALRSGEYTQGQGQLCTGGKKPKHCCLGVLCEIAEKEEKLHDGAPLTRTKRTSGDGILFDGSAGMLPLRVARWAGIRDAHGTLGGKSCGHPSLRGDYASGRDLILDNDEGKSFAEIADIIEARWQAM